jgi:K+-sensing histidine kinase KdpD
MRIVGASASISTAARQSAKETHDSGLPEAQRKALIAIEPPRGSEHLAQSARHPSAVFVAHLIATRMQAPQTRTRRRAEPNEAIAVYRSMTKPVASRRILGRRV